MCHEAGLTHFDNGNIPLHHVPSSLRNEPEKRASFRSFLASQTPKWDPNTGARGYHPLSVGWYLSEIVTSVDPLQRSLGQYFRDEIALQYDIDFYFGLHSSALESRLSRLYAPTSFHLARQPQAIALMDKTSLTYKAFNHVLDDVKPWNCRFSHIPSSIGFGTARGIAELTSVLANQGRLRGQPFIHPATLTCMLEDRGLKHDVIECQPTSLTMGGFYNEPLVSIAPNVAWHSGYGGAFAYADLDRNLGFAYVTNSQRVDVSQETRRADLLNALYHCFQHSKL